MQHTILSFSPDTSDALTALRKNGFRCVDAHWSSPPTLEAPPHVVLIEPASLGMSIPHALSAVGERYPGARVIVFGDARLASALDALRSGAADYLERSSTSHQLQSTVQRVIEEVTVNARAALDTGAPRFRELVGESTVMQELSAQIPQVAASEATVLVSGETGTGKELVARLIHACGPRQHAPLVVVNCAAIPDSLADSELFGHMKGSFSGAVSSHRGLFRAADGGTLFLDDVGTLSLDVQAKLLRTLQEKTVRPVGASGEIRLDFRVVASASTDLRQLVAEQRFREDLYFRLAVLELHVPPLRERGNDLLILAEHFVREGAVRTRKQVRGITPAVARCLLAYPWPGNVRELKNSIDYAIAVARYDHLQENDLPDAIRASQAAPVPVEEDPSWEAAARRHIEAVLRSVDGNRAQAARLLGIDRKTLHRKLARMKIDVPPRTKSGVHSAAATSSLSNDPADASDQSTRYRFIFR